MTRTWIGRIALAVLGATLLPALLLELALRIAPLFLAERATGSGAGARTTIVCIGDSHTYGVYYPQESSYPSQLQRLLDEVLGEGEAAVVALGRPGRATAQVRAGLAEVLAGHRPDFVVVLAGINDRWNHPDAATGSDFLSRHLRLWVVVRMWLAQEAGDRLASRDTTPMPRPEHPIVLDEKALKARVESNLEWIAGAARAAGSQPVFLTYAPSDAAFAAPNAAIRAAAERASVPLVDLQAVFARELERRPGAKLLLPRDRHPVPEGYRIMAREVARKLLELRGADPSAVDRHEPAARAPTIRLERAPDRPDVLIVRCEEPGRFRIVLSTTLPPIARARAHRVALPFAADATFLASLRLPFLAGETDPSGHAEVALPAGALARLATAGEGLFAAALRLGNEAEEGADALALATDCSALLELVPPPR